MTPSLLSRRTAPLLSLLLLVSGLFTVPRLFPIRSVSAQSPDITVAKVEPPNWWTGRRPTKVTILFSGNGFAGASVKTTYPGIRILKSRPAATGTHLFCDLEISPAAKPGDVSFDIVADGRKTSRTWSLAAPLPREGNFQGLTPADVIYLIMPDRFADGDPSNNEPTPGAKTYDPDDIRAYHGGDLRGVINRLDYIKSLGATAVWMTPVYQNDESSRDYHGYHMTDFYGVDKRFGTLADYQELCRELHKRGMKLVLDVVPNHTGPKHTWLKNPPSPTWLNGTPEKHLDCTFKVPFLLDPKAKPEERDPVVKGWFAGTLPDLNSLDPDYKTYAIQNTLWWLNATGLDALRLDTYPYVERSFWRDWQQAIDRDFPTVTDYGEVLNDGLPPESLAFFLGGKKGWDGIDTGLKSILDYPLYFALRDFCFKDKPLNLITDVLAKDAACYRRPDLLVTFIGNHDQSRVMTEAGRDPRRVKLALALLLTLRGVPQLYYADELGMEGGADPDNRRDFPGGFGEARNAFEARDRTLAQNDMWNATQKLLQLRRDHPGLTTGRHENLVTDNRTWVYARSTAKETLVIVANGSATTAAVKLPTTGVLKAGGTLHPLLGTDNPMPIGKDGSFLSLAPFEYRVYRVSRQ